jgi:hypothetical protein
MNVLLGIAVHGWNLRRSSGNFPRIWNFIENNPMDFSSGLEAISSSARSDGQTDEEIASALSLMPAWRPA